ncbi:MAG: hypothetical protein WD396_04140 [Pseudohongiellaceae bacterium]
MGEVVKLNDYRRQSAPPLDEEVTDSLIPVEFAVGLHDRESCLQKIDEYGVRDVEVYRLSVEHDARLYLIGVKDAIWLNKKILEREAISDEEIAQRIDLIQMLENANLSLLQAIWQPFSRRGTGA